jgi:hypothetical protein
MFLIHSQQSRAVRARRAWREAAALVRRRWAVYLEVDPQARTFAFASYMAAVDAEEAAAAELAAVTGRAAA